MDDPNATIRYLLNGDDGVTSPPSPLAPAEDMEASGAWRNLAIPNLATFADILSASKFARDADKLLLGLMLFQGGLNGQYDNLNLKACSPLYALLGPEIKRSDLRFFFTPALIDDGTIVLTVFLEATAEEVARRPANFSNANKHLHHAFFDASGIVRKSREAFERDRLIANTTEHTAYAKFYIRNWGGNQPGVSVLIHPMQRARLKYDPSRDSVYQHFKEKAHRLSKILRGVSGSLGHRAPELAQRYGKKITELAAAIDTLARWAQKITKHEAAVEKLEEARRLARAIPGLAKLGALAHSEQHHESALRRAGAQFPSEGHIREETERPRRFRPKNLRQRVNSLLAEAKMVMDIHRRFHEEHEAPYTAADNVTGEKRELVFLAVSDILRQALKFSLGRAVHRFVLSEQQIDRLRLKTPRGDVRENIKRVPRILAAMFPTKTTTYPLHPVDEAGRVSPSTESREIETICLDQFDVSPRGWRDPIVPGLDSFEPRLRCSRLFQHAPFLMHALRIMELDLHREFSRDSILTHARFLSAVHSIPDFRRDNFRFFFIPTETGHGALSLFVFLEATEEEVRARGPGYTNSHEHICSELLDRAACVPQFELEYLRERAQRTAFSASAQILVDYPDGDRSQLCLVLHALRRTRLVFSPKQTQEFLGNSRNLNEIVGSLRRFRAALEERSIGDRDLYERLDTLGCALSSVAAHIQRDDSRWVTEMEIQRASAILDGLQTHPVILSLTQELPVEMRGEGTLIDHFRTVVARAARIHDLLRNDNTEGPSEADATADRVTGSDRDLALFGVFGMIAHRFRQNLAIPIRSFTLSSRQLRRIGPQQMGDYHYQRQVAIAAALENTLPQFSIRFGLPGVNTPDVKAPPEPCSMTLLEVPRF